MPPIKRRLFFLLLLILLPSCGQDKATPLDEQNLVAPTNEATADQKKLIEATLAKIEATSASLGQSHSFRTIPVLVTSDSPYLNEAKGACVKVGHRPQFILVSPAVLNFETNLPSDSTTSTLFPVLLHEIGHCYFQRAHDASKINLTGSNISLLTKTTNSEEVMESLDASVMAPQDLLMNRQLERYYVAEVIGLVKRHDLEAVNAYAPSGVSMKYVKQQALAKSASRSGG